ncbi:MAG TPA: aminotransferase class IV [Gammaproteobacteria bacterium]|nr:aminotransferase class IV [Gammaproteobacteria bacterium]
MKTDDGIGFMDGRYCPREALSLPVSDLGFALCDMAYDAVHVRDGKFFRLDDHLARFLRAIERRRYTTLAYDRDQIREVLFECVRRAGLRDAMVHVVATRGSPEGFTKDLRGCKNRLLAWSAPYYAVVADGDVENGVGVIISRIPRVPADSIDPTVKNFARLDFSAALLEAYDRGCTHAILLDHDGNVTEGRGWNLFALFGGELISPDSGVLEGITRQTVMELCEQSNLKARLGRIPGENLHKADEIFMASTAGGLIPINAVDGTIIGDGAAGPVTRRLRQRYWALHDDPRYTTRVY